MGSQQMTSAHHIREIDRLYAGIDRKLVALVDGCGAAYTSILGTRTRTPQSRS